MHVPDEVSQFFGEFTPEEIEAGKLTVALLTLAFDKDGDEELFENMLAQVATSDDALKQLIAFAMTGVRITAMINDTTDGDVLAMMGHAYHILGDNPKS